MNHSEILKKKEDRLMKHTGRKLVLKRRALEKALAKFSVGRSERRADPAVPEWLVTPPNGKAFVVRATNEKAARAEARKSLNLKALAHGTNVVRA